MIEKISTSVNLPSTTIVVVLGASSFPLCDLASTVAFEKAHLSIQSYFISEYGYKLPNDNLISLFDSSSDPNSLIKTLRREIGFKIKKISLEYGSASDIIVYYVGHGSFDEDRKYYLALKCTDRDQQSTSSLHVSDLARAINASAPSLRRYFIIDACFSGEAIIYAQSSISDVIGQQIKHIPQNGVAFMCSSSRDETSEFISDHSNTVFTKSLCNVLWNGSAGFPEKLSLELINDLVIDDMRSGNGNVIRSEVHVPDQKHGNIARSISLFPNGPRTKVLENAENNFLLRQQRIFDAMILEKEQRLEAEKASELAISVAAEEAAEKARQDLIRYQRVEQKAIEEKFPIYDSETEKAFREEAEHFSSKTVDIDLIKQWCSWKIGQYHIEEILYLKKQKVLKSKINEHQQAWRNLFSHMQVADKQSSYDTVRSIQAAMLVEQNSENEAQASLEHCSDFIFKMNRYMYFYRNVLSDPGAIPKYVKEASDQKLSFSGIMARKSSYLEKFLTRKRQIRAIKRMIIKISKITAALLVVALVVVSCIFGGK